ncbi:MAG: ABC transporter permease, partial [Planctomycetota bacterium]
MRNVLVIATNTTREIVRQPAFLLVLVLGAAALLLGRYMTLFALGEEVSMFKDIGTSTILLVGLLIVVFASTTTIHEEIE